MNSESTYTLPLSHHQAYNAQAHVNETGHLPERKYPYVNQRENLGSCIHHTSRFELSKIAVMSFMQIISERLLITGDYVDFE